MTTEGFHLDPQDARLAELIRENELLREQHLRSTQTLELLRNQHQQSTQTLELLRNQHQQELELLAQPELESKVTCLAYIPPSDVCVF